MITWVQILIFPKHTYLLTHSFPIHSFSTPWKHQKTIRLSDVFRGEKMGALGTNGLTHLWPMFQFYTPSKHQKVPLVFWCFQGVSNGSFGHKWVNPLVPNAPFFYPQQQRQWKNVNSDHFYKISICCNLMAWLKVDYCLKVSGKWRFDNFSTALL